MKPEVFPLRKSKLILFAEKKYQTDQETIGTYPNFSKGERPKVEAKTCARCEEDIPEKTDCRRRQFDYL